MVVSGTGSTSNPYVIDAIAQAGGGGGGGGTPAERLPGEIIMYGGALAPTGWLLCDGSAVSRTVYPNLYAAIGTNFGAGDGSSTFNLPNLSAKFPRGTSATATLGSEGGAASASFTLAAANLPPHAHSIGHDHDTATTTSAGTHDHQIRTNDDGGFDNGVMGTGAQSPVTNTSTPILDDGAHTHSVNIPALSSTVNSGNGPGTSTPVGVATVPPYLSLNFVIKT